MDIIKKLTIFLWLLAVLLITPTVLRSFDVSPKEMFKVLFGETAPSPKENKKTTPSKEVPEKENYSNQEARPDISVPPPPKKEEEVSSKEEKAFNAMISGLEKISSVASEDTNVDFLPSQVRRPVDSVKKVRWSPPPAGFQTADTFNYLIYREQQPVSGKIKSVLDNIHGNLMLDLTPFTIIMKPNKILVMLFGKKETYMSFTNRPAWSGASSDLRADTMYIIEGKSFYAMSVHELTHLYFDGYFLPTISPLWLSEGMAVYMQIHSTKQKPHWVDHSLKRILSGNYIKLEEMTRTEDLSAYSTEQAELWYTQAYSLIDYLLNTRPRNEFYKFCNEIKAKTPLHQALYRAYGMPFNRVSVLENVWLHDLQKSYQNEKNLNKPAIPVKADNPVAPAGKKESVKPPQEPKPAPQEEVRSAPKPKPKKTKINKLEMVPTNGYKGGF